MRISQEWQSCLGRNEGHMGQCRSHSFSPFVFWAHPQVCCHINKQLPACPVQICLPCWAEMFCSSCLFLVGKVDEILSDRESWRILESWRSLWSQKNKNCHLKKEEKKPPTPPNPWNRPGWLRCALKSKKVSVFSQLSAPRQPGLAHPVRAVLMLQYCFEFCMPACTQM